MQKNLRISDAIGRELEARAKASNTSQGRILEEALTAYFDTEQIDRLSDIERRVSRLEEVAGL